MVADPLIVVEDVEHDGDVDRPRRNQRFRREDGGVGGWGFEGTPFTRAGLGLRVVSAGHDER